MVPLTYESTGSSQNRGKTESHRQKGKSERTNKMKKLMITAAAAMTAMVGFCTIESSNVVGYANTALKNGATPAGCQFVNVSTGGAIDLTTIIPAGYDEVSEGELTAQTLDAYGRTTATYYWYDVEGEVYGWLDDTDEPVKAGAVMIQPGAGLWFVAPDEGYSFVSSGSVLTQGDVSVGLRSGALPIANPTPVPVDLTDIIVNGYEGDTEGDVTVQELDSYGRTTSTYYWYDVEGELYGWLDDADEPIEEGAVMVQPGAGLWAVSPSDEFSVVWPKVTL